MAKSQRFPFWPLLVVAVLAFGGSILQFLALKPSKPKTVTDQLDSLRLPEATQQVLLTLTPSWEDSAGKLQRFERELGGKWEKTGSAVPVMIGRTGLAWGVGMHEDHQDDAPQKVEGDGKATAGIFSLGTAFGYAQEAPESVSYPYRVAGENDFFVDDAGSAEYNQWVQLGEEELPGERWKSFERMRRPDTAYQWGVVVDHNTDPAAPGRGSAIFLHVWKSPQTPTAGCTAMDEANMLGLLEWLDPAKSPLLIQIPEPALTNLRPIKP